MYVWSKFCIYLPSEQDGIIIKNMLTGAVIYLTSESFESVNSWIKNENESKPESVENLLGENSFLVSDQLDEFENWSAKFLDARNNQAHILTLHFLPTLQCQLHCAYCFEKGVKRGGKMSSLVIDQSRHWVDEYLSSFPEIDTFRLAFFGGEPLLHKDVVQTALENFHGVSFKYGVEFYSEITTNAEFLDMEIASIFSKHNWRRVQITLDGQKEIHDARRFGNKKRPTFDSIMQNIRMLLSSDFIPSVDIRVSLDLENFHSVQGLVYDLSKLENFDRINLSIGITTSSLGNGMTLPEECNVAENVLAVWKIAKECGFKIPEDFVVGPWCVAIAKHSAVIQPNGSLQKCFCTSGRRKYDFGNLEQGLDGYARDSRFENFQRSNPCLSEECEYLPVCGGGCLHDAIVSYGQSGFEKRFCQKQIIADMNRGLLRLNYE